MNDQLSNLKPRKEALVLSTASMTDAQFAAGQRVHALVNAMAAEAWEPRSRQSGLEAALPRIDTERSNRTILIDGDRGSGKTSLLVSLLDYWNRLRLQRSMEAYGPSKVESDGPAKTLDRPGWQAPEFPVLPVGLVELQPLPPTTNLLVYVTSSLCKLLNAVEEASGVPGGTRGSDAPWRPGRVASVSARDAWNTFAAQAASGWDGSLRERSGQMDAEQYAVELENTEQNRLGAMSSFRTFVDRLIEDVSAWLCFHQKKPLLVLAFDDADMNPDLALPLLDLLRTFAHPRLAFLLTGSSRLFQWSMRTHMLAALGKPLKGLPIADTAAADLPSESAMLAWNTYQKAIPEHHHCTIDSLPPRVRVERLRDLLAAVSLSSSERRGIFKNPDQPVMSDYFDAIDQLGSALPDTLRILNDLAEGVQRDVGIASDAHDGVQNPSRGRIAARLVRRLWENALRHPLVDSTMRRLLDGCVELNDAGRLRADGTGLEWDVRYVQGTECGSDEFTVRFGELQPLRMKLRTSPRTPAHRLPEEVTASFLLANIVSLDSEWDAFSVAPALAEGFDGVFARASWTLHGKRFHFGWPTPDADLILDILLFGRRWAEFYKRNCDDWKSSPMTVCERFLGGMIHIADPDLGVSDSSKLADIVRGLSDLQPLDATNTPRLSTRKAIFTAWARERALLLAAPESGLPSETAAQLLEAGRKAFDAGSWQSICQGLKRSRGARAEAAIRHAADSRQADDLLAQLDEGSPAHPWITYVNKAG